MAVIPERRLALLGGGFSTDDDGLLDDWVLDQVRAPRPKVCFVPTASGDAPAYVEQFLAAHQSRSCVPSVLQLFRRDLDDDDLRTFLVSQDVVYVGGGNTANLLSVWRANGVDRLLREAFDRGTLLCGISAGANCWAEGSHTDSFGPLAHLSDGLGVLSGSVCPHYDSEPGRRSSYQTAVALALSGRVRGPVTRSRSPGRHSVMRVLTTSGFWLLQGTVTSSTSRSVGEQVSRQQAMPSCSSKTGSADR